MRRLQPYQQVEVCASSSFDARVIAVDRRQVALHPAEAVEVLWLPEESNDVLLMFVHEGQRVILKGALSHRGDLNLIGFVVTDKVCLAARSTRIATCAPIGLLPVDGAGRAVGGEIWHQTVDVGAEAAALEPACPLPAGTQVKVSLALPTDVALVEARGVVADAEDGGREVRWLAIDPAERARIHRHVVHERLLELKRRFSPQEEAYVW